MYSNRVVVGIIFPAYITLDNNYLKSNMACAVLWDVKPYTLTHSLARFQKPDTRLINRIIRQLSTSEMN